SMAHASDWRSPVIAVKKGAGTTSRILSCQNTHGSSRGLSRDSLRTHDQSRHPTGKPKSRGGKSTVVMGASDPRQGGGVDRVGDPNDPRVFFAADRTLLAWVRTGLTIMGLGFVVARFGLFLRLLRRDPHGGSHIGSTLIGVGLVLLGSVAIALAAWQHV